MIYYTYYKKVAGIINVKRLIISNMKKEIFARFIRWFKNGFRPKETIICCAITFLAFSIVFPSGMLSSETTEEKCAEYFVDVSLNHTVNDGNKKLTGLIVEPKEGHNVQMDGNTQLAIDNLWGAFKGTNASFAPVINANKELDYRFAESYSDYSDKALSILYSAPGCGDCTEGYHYEEKIKNEETGEMEPVYIDYKFQCCPLATMFQSTTSGTKTSLHIYISQSMAERYLKNNDYKGKALDIDAFKTLLNKEVDIDFGGEARTCIIDNIYLDNFKHEYPFPYKGHKYDYYYGTDVGTILGDFIFVFLHGVQKQVVPSTFKMQGLYFMSEYSFRNRFYFNYAKQGYNPNDYTYKVAVNNLKDGYSPNYQLLNEALFSESNNVWCNILTVLLVLIYIGGLALTFIFKIYQSPLSILLISTSMVVPYLLFKMLFLITKNILLFSAYSAILNFILIIVFAALEFGMLIFTRKLKKGDNHD